MWPCQGAGAAGEKGKIKVSAGFVLQEGGVGYPFLPGTLLGSVGKRNNGFSP